MLNMAGKIWGDFRNIKFPYTSSRDTEIKIEFMVGLKKGKIAKKVAVWFFVPDGFGFISPPEEKSWRQTDKFIVPNIRTVKIELGDINKGVSMRGSLKVKSPNITGEYFLMYYLQADGYSSDTERIKIIVQ
jgi:hypothetical protein